MGISYCRKLNRGAHCIKVGNGPLRQGGLPIGQHVSKSKMQHSNNHHHIMSDKWYKWLYISLHEQMKVI